MSAAVGNRGCERHVQEVNLPSLQKQIYLVKPARTKAKKNVNLIGVIDTYVVCQGVALVE
jgi:hypothetical protein